MSVLLAANWAQTSGTVRQSVTKPYIPSVENQHWQSRFGALTIALANSTIGAADSLFVLGGDTYENENLPIDLDIRSADWTHGYKNDVWVTEGTEWITHPDIALRNRHGQKLPRQTSYQRWDKRQKGLLPPIGVTYDEWISCQPAVIANKPNREVCSEPEWQYPVQWSPRRFHAGVFFKDFIWVFGGRARESHELPEIRSVGGIFNPRVADIERRSDGKNFDQIFTNQREASVYKSDVWKSRDGVTWQLVTPGCKAPQLNLVAAGNPKEGKHGKKEAACVTDEDCYKPAEQCLEIENGFFTCVCKMWSPREQHQAAVFKDNMYVVGGYASRLFSESSNCGGYACGDVDASSYRYYMQDVWRSTDGENWFAVTFGTSDGFPGRGGHQMLVLDTHNGIPAYFYIFGGRGGDPTTNEQYYFNDIWRSPAENPALWEQVTSSEVGWEPRTSHVVLLETPSALNRNTRNILLYGGKNASGTILEDVWMWRPDIPGEPWRKDFEQNALYRSGSGASFAYREDSPATYYVYPDAPIEYLRRFWVPPSDEKAMGSGLRPKELSFLTDKKLEQLHTVGIETIRDLATADKYQILRLRGHDYPQVEETDLMNFVDVCNARVLAEAVVEKCTLKEVEFYDGHRGMPWNVRNVWGGPPPAVGSNPEWHGVDYSHLHVEKTADELIDEWDGCSHLSGETLPNVIGLGKVTQVSSITNPKAALQELQCRYTPGPRMMHFGAYFEERFYIFGGFTAENKLAADSWYRDDRMPTVQFKKKPPSRSSVPHFRFASDEGGVAYEYRVYNPATFQELREWTPVVSKHSVDWLDWRMGGPGNGYYTLYVRGIDPAGNRDETYENGRNVYTWFYESPTPWDIILGSLFGFLFLCLLCYLEYRRRMKRAAMERYAMKRMRRKFKAMQTDQDNRQVDWRTLYNESKAEREAKDPELIKRQKKAAANNNKAKVKREKEVVKREKEKEKIKKKLAAARKGPGGAGGGTMAGSSAILDAFSTVNL